MASSICHVFDGTKPLRLELLGANRRTYLRWRDSRQELCADLLWRVCLLGWNREQWQVYGLTHLEQQFVSGLSPPTGVRLVV